MGYPLHGLAVDRYGDVLSGYFLQKCAAQCGEAVRIGTPIVTHRRTPRDALRDLRSELGGMAVLEVFLPWLIEVPLSGRTYGEAYGALAEALAGAAGGFQGGVWEEGGRAFLAATSASMRTWLHALRTIG